MTFTPATGSNSDVANSYVDTDYALQYWNLRGSESWGNATENQQQTALVKATDYIEQVYSARFIGVKYCTEGLSWPRYNAHCYQCNVIPDALKKATCELALEALTGDLNPVIVRADGVKREKVDVIETEYFEPKFQAPLRPSVTGYLTPLLKGSVYNVPVVRV